MNEQLKNLMAAMSARRSQYALAAEWVRPQSEVEEMLKQVLLNVPSAFNSQPVRMVLLTGEHHRKHWELIEQTLIEKMGEEAYNERTREKIHKSFMAGVGTVLFFDDRQVTQKLQEQYASYADLFPEWATQVQGSHQFAVWVALTAMGFGANLQHYIRMVDRELARQTGLDIPVEWVLSAQMPFGKALDNPDTKDKLDPTKTLLIP